MEPPPNHQLVQEWLESQPVQDQKFLAIQKLTEYLEQAAQPRHASGNACIRLCYFIEQCRDSSSSALKDVAFSSETCVSLFNFYIEWNEKNQNRSMRQILELVSSLIVNNPDQGISQKIKKFILDRDLSIITRRGAQPLVKPAFKSLESFLAKKTITTDELISAFHDLQTDASKHKEKRDINFSAYWDQLVEVSFEWMTLPDISPAAGKFLVTIFRETRTIGANASQSNESASWQRWIRNGLAKDPDCLENVKNYLFPPLFKIDRPGSLLLLEELNKLNAHHDNKTMDSNALLQLAAMEAGKKAGLAEDSAFTGFQKPPKRKATSIMLREDTIEPLLSHPLDSVRSLAFSVIVHSSSSIRPYTAVTLRMLRSSLCVLYSDTDAKFRNDVLSNTKHMVERLRGATAFLTREIDLLSYQMEHNNELQASKNKTAESNPQKISELRDDHVNFLEWILHFLLGELIPTASYQRHITALKALCLLLKSGILRHEGQNTNNKVTDNETVWPFQIVFFGAESIRLLLDLLLDPFEDVRVTATEILKLAPSSAFIESGALKHKDALDVRWVKVSSATRNIDQEHEHLPSMSSTQPKLNSHDSLHQFLKRASSISLRTGRADYADGVAHTYEIMYSLSNSDAQNVIESLVRDLETNVSLAKRDLSEAVHSAPVHGTFSSLSLIWVSLERKDHRYESGTHTMSEFQQRIFGACSQIWDAVRDVLCNDSPEGHLPQELDDTEVIDTKDVLSYSFRAIHESSNLMRTLASQIKQRSLTTQPVIVPDLFSAIGRLSFEQLSTLRHRGAFSTVSLTFARVCQLSHFLPSNASPNGPELLNQFYRGALDCISEQASTTRRSAGIPALVAGVLSANAASPSFQEVMTELKNLSNRPIKLSEIDETNLPQVHAMNCLREIFKSSTLGKRAESHIADGLQISSDSLSSDIWAIRNCGLLLLRSLIDCLFGTSESKQITEAGWEGKSIRLSYDKYPSLPELLLKLLESETDDLKTQVPQIGTVESVFPALDIIRRAGPPEAYRDQIYNGVCNHLGSKVWHIRDLAARTVSTLLLHDGWLSAIEGLLSQCDGRANKTHGTLLAVRFVIERQNSLNHASLIDSLPKLLPLLPNSDGFITLEINSPHIRGANLELQNILAGLILSSRQENLRSLPFALDLVNENSLEALKRMSDQPVSDALLQLAMLRRVIIRSALLQNSIGLTSLLNFIIPKSVDLSLAAAKIIFEVWQLSTDSLTPLSRALIQMTQYSKSPQVRAVAGSKLADLLDQLFVVSVTTHRELIPQIETLGTILGDGIQSPELINASIKLSGWIQLRSFLPHSAVEGGDFSKLSGLMEGWGGMLSSAGESRNDFDTRLAAVCALRSFFAFADLDIIPTKPYMLPTLFALYDTLNDDDDEIRNIGAEAVSAILKRPLVPLAAQIAFLDWIVGFFADSELLVWTVIRRLTGSNTQHTSVEIEPAERQLQASLREDNSLFVEEEQNLFVDEVRESKQWAHVFSNLPSKVLNDVHSKVNLGSPISLLEEWTISGLKKISKILNLDGPLGWTSKPAAFTACMRIIVCANAVLELHRKSESDSDKMVDCIRAEMERLRGIESFHPTILGYATIDLA